MNNIDDHKVYLIYNIKNINDFNDTLTIKAFNTLFPIKTIPSLIKLTEILSIEINNKDSLIIYYQSDKYTKEILELINNSNKNIKIFIYINNDTIKIKYNNYTILTDDNFPISYLTYNYYEYQLSNMIDKIFTPNTLLLSENVNPNILASKYTYLINTTDSITTNYSINNRKCQYYYNVYNLWIITEIFNKSKCYYTNSNDITPLVMLALYSNNMILCNKTLYDKLLNINVMSLESSSVSNINQIELQKSIIESNKEYISKYCNDKIEIITDVYNNLIIGV